MKKMKMFLLAAMLIGIGSAFTNASTNVDQLWVVGPDDDYITQEAGNLLNGVCDPAFTSEKCTYLDAAGTMPNPSSPVGRYVYE